jgi:hypothetical protein
MRSAVAFRSDRLCAEFRHAEGVSPRPPTLRTWRVTALQPPSGDRGASGGSGRYRHTRRRDFTLKGWVKTAPSRQPHSGKTHSQCSGGRRLAAQTHRRTNNNAINRQRAERNPYRGRVAASSTADGSRVTADCALDAIILTWVGGFPPATNGGTVSLDLRGRDLHDTRSASPPPRLHINDSYREKR